MRRMAIAPERELVLQAVRELARERIAPRAAEIDETAEFPWDMVELFRENDLFGLPFDEELGGTGTGTLVLLRAVEEVSKFDATVALLIAVQELGSLAVKLFGTDEHRRFYVPRWAGGEWLPGYALTQPESGSHSAALRTSAPPGRGPPRRDGDTYVLDGQKRFITNAGVAHTYCVFAKTDTSKGHDGISA